MQKIHVIFKTHLDIGFTDLAQKVTKLYFDEYIPKAIQTARKMREQGQRFIWTTGSWLIYEYLEQSSTQNRRIAEAAIDAGDIVWHGLPFTTHTELMDANLMRVGLSLSKRLDERFGKHTIAAKMTDVPGHTRGLVSLLAEAGIQFLHIGVNPAATPTEVPPVFTWRSSSGAEVVVMYHKGSYGDEMIVPGLDEAITFAHTGDNLGPQSVENAQAELRLAQAMFPHAIVEASTLDAFGTVLLGIKSTLPLICDELGDTWIRGVGTDPTKVRHFRVLQRLHASWVKSSVNANLDRFSRALLMIPEHTWGMDIKTHLRDWENYTASQFLKARNQPSFRLLESSWLEQRQYLEEAISALPPSQALEAREALQHSDPSPTRQTNRAESVAFTNNQLSVSTKYYDVQFAPDDGRIVSLTNRVTGHQWADHYHPLGKLSYQTFSVKDYERFYEQYIVSKISVEDWAIPDNTKPGLALSHSESRLWALHLDRISQYQEDDFASFLLEWKVSGEAVDQYGCPRRFVMELQFPNDAPEIRFDLQWFDKSATRLPEAIWFSFSPITQQPAKWQFEKLGEWISPLEVISGGSRSLHAIERDIRYSGEAGAFSIESLDAPLVAPGKPTLLDFTNELPDMSNGVHFNLYNNTWGTNFPMWFDEDARFRFTWRERPS